MKTYLYSVLDKLSGIYSYPVAHLNDNCAVRWYVQLLNESKVEPTDYALYRVGIYEQTKGLIKKDFKFIKALTKGEKVSIDILKDNENCEVNEDEEEE